MGNPSNPNGSNQYQLDPRQNLCWKYYINPTSETFGNGTQSAIKAGYEPDYADQITTTEWFKGKVRRLNMLNKAEVVLEEMLTMPVGRMNLKDKMGEEEEVVTTDTGLVKIKQDTAKFLAERLGKNEGYTIRTEHTGKDGDPIALSVEKTEEISKAIDEL
jgi:phage terminase small subunit